MRTLNLGILAHVDAGKTTLSERLLYTAGAIDRLGSVDAGTTQTDSLELERERGITIRSAVASFLVGDLAVNLVDTPGHPDFIAEVERVLGVLDGAILVVSAVEGVQPQTPLLFRALQRLHVPTLIFVNKIDRSGADPERVLDEMRRRLAPALVPMARVANPGRPDVAVELLPADDASHRAALTEVLAEHDDAIFDAFVDDEAGLAEGALVTAFQFGLHPFGRTFTAASASTRPPPLGRSGTSSAATGRGRPTRCRRSTASRGRRWTPTIPRRPGTSRSSSFRSTTAAAGTQSSGTRPRCGQARNRSP